MCDQFPWGWDHLLESTLGYHMRFILGMIILLSYIIYMLCELKCLKFKLNHNLWNLNEAKPALCTFSITAAISFVK